MFQGQPLRGQRTESSPNHQEGVTKPTGFGGLHVMSGRGQGHPCSCDLCVAWAGWLEGLS